MDEIAAFLFIGALFVFGPWVIVAIMGARRRRERRETEERLATLTQRVYQLEVKFKDLAQRGIALAAEPKPAAAPAPPVAEPRPAVPLTPPLPAAAPPPPAPAAPEPKREPAQQPWPKPAESPYFPRPTTSPAQPAPAPIAPPPVTPQPAAAPRAQASFSAPPAVAPARITAPPITPPPQLPRQKSEFEKWVGENWLVFIGIVLLVLGIGYGLSVWWQNVGPLGKDAIGITAGALLLAAGIWIERKPAYRLFGYAGVGGGWAVLFFMTYALYHVPATQILRSQLVDLVLLLVVAAAMVGHTLRYNSQAVTGLAFLLAFWTVTISRVNVYSLGAGAILALALVVIVSRKRWYMLEVFGILATYLNHWWWLHSIIEPMGGNKVMFPEFFASAGILLLYWGAYRTSYVLRSIEHDEEERLSTVAAILNTGLLLFVLKYQSVTPKYAFYALLVIGLAELTLGWLLRARERREAFVVLATMGAALSTAAFPFKFSGGELSILWLVVAEVFYLAGVFTDELVFRRLGRIAELVVAVQLYWSHPLDAPKSWRNSMVFWMAALMFGANSHLVPWRWPKIFETQWERFGVRLVSWMGVAMAMTAMWLALPQAWIAVGWAVLALWLAVAGYLLAQEELSYQANVVAILATIGTLAINFSDERPFYGVITMRLLTVSLVAVLLYATSRFSMTPKLATAAGGIKLRPIYTWAAAVLITLVAFYELDYRSTEAWIPVIWALFGVALAYLGRRQQARDLVLQSNLLGIFAVLYTLIVNTNHPEAWRWGLTVRLATSALVIGLLYAQAHWADIEGWPWTRGLGMLHAWAASFLVCWVMWYELQPVSVAVAWALFGAGLLELGLVRLDSNKFWRAQAYIALGAAFIRLFFVNLNAAGVPGQISPRVYTTVPIALLLFYSYWRLDSFSQLPTKELTRRSTALFSWMGTITVVALVRFELAPDWVVAAWAGIVGVLMMIGWRSERAGFVAQALALTVAVAFRTSMYNFYNHSYFAQLSWQQRWLPAAAAIALLFLGLYPAFQVREWAARAGGIFQKQLIGPLLRRPEQWLFFAASGLLAVLLYLEVNDARVTIAWALEAIALISFALAVRETSFRRAGLALLLIGIGKIVLLDIWSFNRAQVAVTLVSVGIGALGVGFLYTRFQEALKEYL